MIKSIRHHGLKIFFLYGNAKQLNPHYIKRLTTILDALNTANTTQDMNLPGLYLHELKGNRKGTWTIRISGNWRLTFSFHNGNAYYLDLEDYH